MSALTAPTMNGARAARSSILSWCRVALFFLLLTPCSSLPSALSPPEPLPNSTSTPSPIGIEDICKSLEQKAKINKIFKEVIESFANYILEDDIIVDENFIEIMGCAKFLSAKQGKGTFGSSSFYWPEGIVPFKIDFDLVSQTSTIQEAVEIIESLTNIQMPLHTDEAYFILFRKEQNTLVCGSSYVGRKNSFVNVGQPVFISLSPVCGLATVIHETLHALGFIHEHQRSDRDDYITVNDDCFPDNVAGNFIKDLDASKLTKYDYNSVLHYHKTAFGTSDCPSISTTNPDYENVIGACKSISPCDVAAVNALYSPTLTSGSFECDYSCVCNIETSELPNGVFEKLQACDANEDILLSWLNAPPPPPATLLSFPDTGEIDYPPCLDELQVTLSTPFAGLDALPCGLLGTLTCSLNPDAITVDGDEYCKRTCRTCPMPSLAFTVDVDARLAFSFDRPLRIVDVYVNSPAHEIFAMEFTYRCAFPLNNKIISKTIGYPMTDLTTLVVDSVGELSGQVYLFGAFGTSWLPAQAHHLLQMQVNFEQACDLLVLEDVQMSSPTQSLSWCGAGASDPLLAVCEPLYPSPPPPAPIYSSGDVSLDGVLDIGDVVLMACGAKQESDFLLSSLQLQVADIIPDSTLNFNDTLKLVQTLALA